MEAAKERPKTPVLPPLLRALRDGRPKVSDWDIAFLSDDRCPGGEADRLRIVKQDHHPTTGFTALHQAAATGHIEAMGWLLARGASVHDKIARDGRTALHCAVQSRQPKCLEYLVDDHGADIRVCDNMGRTALFFATRLRAESVQAWLKQRGLRFERTSRVLIDAICTGHTSRDHLARIIKEEPVDVAEADEMGMAAIHHAAAADDLDVLLWLITEHGVDPWVLSRTNRRIEQYAAAAGALKVLEWALDRGNAELKRQTTQAEGAVNGLQWTHAKRLQPSLLQLASHASHESVVRYLVMRGFTH